MLNQELNDILSPESLFKDVPDGYTPAAHWSFIIPGKGLPSADPGPGKDKIPPEATVIEYFGIGGCVYEWIDPDGTSWMSIHTHGKPDLLYNGVPVIIQERNY